jgi:hypothetical protein
MKRRLPSVPSCSEVIDYKGKGPSEDCHKDCHFTANLTGKAKNVRVNPNRVNPNITKNYKKILDYMPFGYIEFEKLRLGHGATAPARGVRKMGHRHLKKGPVLHYEMPFHNVVCT